MAISGMEVIILSSTIMVDRSWRERLWSMPWRPWRSVKWIANPIIEPGTVLVERGKIFCTIEQFNELKSAACRPSMIAPIQRADPYA